MTKLFPLIVLSMFFVACQPNASTNNQTDTEKTTPIATPNSNNNATSNKGAFNPPHPVDNSPFTAALLKDWWVVEYWVDAVHPENDRPNKGRWYKFNQDGTFTGGLWEDEKEHGSYKVFLNHKDEWVLRIDSNIDRLDAEWGLLINKAGDEMSWVGTETYPAYDPVTLKLIELGSRPTKKQFGME